MVIARGMRPTLNVSSTSFWNPSFSSRMATGNKPPYAVRLLPSKSYGVEAPILLGSGITRSAPCGTRLSSLCSLLRLTIWVTPRSRLAKLELRGLSVLQQDFRGPQVVLSFSPSYSTQRPCIGQVPTPGRAATIAPGSSTRTVGGESKTPSHCKATTDSLLVALIQTPHRFRTKRQRWAYSGLALETRTSAEYRYVEGQVRRSKKLLSIRGLNKDHNHDLKGLFKGVATMASVRPGPFQDFYQASLAKGIKPTMARLTLARKIAAITLTLWKKGESFDAEKLKSQAA